MTKRGKERREEGRGEKGYELYEPRPPFKNPLAFLNVEMGHNQRVTSIIKALHVDVSV